MRIQRMLIINMVKEFKNSKTVNGTLKTILVSSRGNVEEGDDFGGVFRDALSSFWAELLKGHATGESEMALCIKHDSSLQDWQSVGCIFVKEHTDLKYFPLPLFKSFVIVAFFDEVLSSEEMMEVFFCHNPFADVPVLRKSNKSVKFTRGGQEPCD